MDIILEAIKNGLASKIPGTWYSKDIDNSYIHKITSGKQAEPFNIDTTQKAGGFDTKLSADIKTQTGEEYKHPLVFADGNKEGGVTWHKNAKNMPNTSKNIIQYVNGSKS